MKYKRDGTPDKRCTAARSLTPETSLKRRLDASLDETYNKEASPNKQNASTSPLKLKNKRRAKLI